MVIGTAGAALLDRLTGGELLAGEAPLVLPLVCLIIAVVGLLATVGPARRGLRIDATEALKAEG